MVQICPKCGREYDEVRRGKVVTTPEDTEKICQKTVKFENEKSVLKLYIHY